jgi:hypothetical protein
MKCNSKGVGTCREEVEDFDGPRRRLQQHPSFPHLPPATPLTFTLTAAACMSEQPQQRPGFEQLLMLLADMHDEVAKGHYINSLGRIQVWPSTSCSAATSQSYQSCMRSAFEEQIQ